jgi:hypothetical protein
VFSFGEKSPFNFNYLDVHNPLKSNVVLQKQMNNSFELSVEQDGVLGLMIKELKLTNQDIITWEDYWLDGSLALADPLIERVDLQKNKLFHANFNLPRNELKYLNLEGNINLRAVLIYKAPKLEELNISNCKHLDVINLGSNENIKRLFAKNCNLSEIAQENLLRSLTPVKTSSSNTPFSMFRKTYETVLDLRGSEIYWGNRKIASKIRLLICNNWLVLWDNPPPSNIVPAQMYAFFPSTLPDSLIKDYYGRLT